MIKVWVLVATISYGFGLVVQVDNIATEADCKRLGERIASSKDLAHQRGGYVCTQVWKVRP